MATNEAKKDDFIVTTVTHNYVSQKATLEGAHNVEIKGRTIIHEDVTIQAESARVSIGRFTQIRPGCRITPPQIPDGEPIPVRIGANTWFDVNVTCEAAAVGSFCWLGKNCRIGARVLMKDCCVVADDAVLPPDLVVPPFTRVSMLDDGRLHFLEMPPSINVVIQEHTEDYYFKLVEGLQ